MDKGAAIRFDPDEADPAQESCAPPDLHKYTGTKDQIPEGGFAAHDSYLDFPHEGDADDDTTG